MYRAARLSLVFAVLFAFFLIAPAYLNQPFGPYPLLRVGNILDLLTPLVLIPVYWLLFQVAPDRRIADREMLVFLVLAGLWVMGHSTHLAANAIGHLNEGLAGDAPALTHFIDEDLSHNIWLLGILGLAALIIDRQQRHPFVGPRQGDGLVLAAAAIHGFNYFLSIVKAGTNGLGIGFAVTVVVIYGLWQRRELGQRPIARFFVFAYALSLVFFLAWGLYWGGLPEFSQVGLLN